MWIMKGGTKINRVEIFENVTTLNFDDIIRKEKSKYGGEGLHLYWADFAPLIKFRIKDGQEYLGATHHKL